MGTRHRELLRRRVTRRARRAISAVNIWHPTLFIAAGIGYHPIMLASNVFGFAGGACPEPVGAGPDGERVGCGCLPVFRPAGPRG